MRLRHADGTTIHLAYCTNVHPAEDVDGVVGQLARFTEPVRHRLGVDLLGVGLWLARDTAAGLARDGAARRRLRAELHARGLEVVTVNAFPYRGFHAPVVGHAVYAPDWSERSRLDYTVDVAEVLADLLPDEARGSISTLPLGWGSGWTPARGDAARRHLAELAEHLERLEATTGRVIRVGLEPEPGCVAETINDAVVHLASVDTDRIGVCLDICHLAVAFEDPATALARLEAAGLPIVKAQASCALHVADPADPASRTRLERFVEPRFLHQTRVSPPGGDGGGGGAGVAVGVDDLAEALHGPRPLRTDAPWRVHFHLPLHARPPAPLASTSPVLVDTLTRLFGGRSARTDHLEVETYTWDVLPAGQRPTDDAGLVAGIAAELDWARRHLTAVGLSAVAPGGVGPGGVGQAGLADPATSVRS
ncbi:metabolite traffic protein EboE [Frankia sp. Cpl3]|nr:metabolite traffic protein EboE [Frankia sp. Cpl3]